MACPKRQAKPVPEPEMVGSSYSDSAESGTLEGSSYSNTLEGSSLSNISEGSNNSDSLDGSDYSSSLDSSESSDSLEGSDYSRCSSSRSSPVTISISVSRCKRRRRCSSGSRSSRSKSSRRRSSRCRSSRRRSSRRRSSRCRSSRRSSSRRSRSGSRSSRRSSRKSVKKAKKQLKKVVRKVIRKASKIVRSLTCKRKYKKYSKKRLAKKIVKCAQRKGTKKAVKKYCGSKISKSKLRKTVKKIRKLVKKCNKAKRKLTKSKSSRRSSKSSRSSRSSKSSKKAFKRTSSKAPKKVVKIIKQKCGLAKKYRNVSKRRLEKVVKKSLKKIGVNGTIVKLASRKCSQRRLKSAEKKAKKVVKKVEKLGKSLIRDASKKIKKLLNSSQLRSKYKGKSISTLRNKFIKTCKKDGVKTAVNKFVKVRSTSKISKICKSIRKDVKKIVKISKSICSKTRTISSKPTKVIAKVQKEKCAGKVTKVIKSLKIKKEYKGISTKTLKAKVAVSLCKNGVTKTVNKFVSKEAGAKAIKKCVKIAKKEVKKCQKGSEKVLKAIKSVGISSKYEGVKKSKLLFKIQDSLAKKGAEKTVKKFCGGEAPRSAIKKAVEKTKQAVKTVSSYRALPKTKRTTLTVQARVLVDKLAKNGFLCSKKVKEVKQLGLEQVAKDVRKDIAKMGYKAATKKNCSRTNPPSATQIKKIAKETKKTKVGPTSVTRVVTLDSCKEAVAKLKKYPAKLTNKGKQEVGTGSSVDVALYLKDKIDKYGAKKGFSFLTKDTVLVEQASKKLKNRSISTESKSACSSKSAERLGTLVASNIRSLKDLSAKAANILQNKGEKRLGIYLKYKIEKSGKTGLEDVIKSKSICNLAKENVQKKAATKCQKISESSVKKVVQSAVKNGAELTKEAKKAYKEDGEKGLKNFVKKVCGGEGKDGLKSVFKNKDEVKEYQTKLTKKTTYTASVPTSRSTSSVSSACIKAGLSREGEDILRKGKKSALDAKLAQLTTTYNRETAVKRLCAGGVSEQKIKKLADKIEVKKVDLGCKIPTKDSAYSCAEFLAQKVPQYLSTEASKALGRGLGDLADLVRSQVKQSGVKGGVSKLVSCKCPSDALKFACTLIDAKYENPVGPKISEKQAIKVVTDAINNPSIKLSKEAETCLKTGGVAKLASSFQTTVRNLGAGAGTAALVSKSVAPEQKNKIIAKTAAACNSSSSSSSRSSSASSSQSSYSSSSGSSISSKGYSSGGSKSSSGSSSNKSRRGIFNSRY